MQRNFLHSLKAYLWELRGWLVVVHVHTTKRAQKIHGTRNGTHSKVAAIKKSISCIASTTKYSILSPLCRDIHYGFHATATTHGQHFEDLQQHGLFNLPKNAKQRGTEEESINRILLTTKSQNVVCFFPDYGLHCTGLGPRSQSPRGTWFSREKYGEWSVTRAKRVNSLCKNSPYWVKATETCNLFRIIAGKRLWKEMLRVLQPTFISVLQKKNQDVCMLQNFVAWLQKVESSWQWFLFFQQNYGKLRNFGVWCDRFDSFII